MYCPVSIIEGVEFLKQGKIIAYPTEAVFGFGCCPHNDNALQSLLNLKHRPSHKGFILIASSEEQLYPFLDLSFVSSEKWEAIRRKWPGPHTFVFPASDKVHPLVTGTHSTVAVRVTAHPIASQLCSEFGGAIVSTSANEANSPPFKNGEALFQHFNGKIAGIVAGDVGNALEVTSISDALTGQIYR